MTEAQKRAEKKYRQDMKQIVLRYKESEREDYEKAKSLGSVEIKSLIRRSAMTGKFVEMVECWVCKYSTDVDENIELFESYEEAESYGKDRIKQYNRVVVFKSLAIADGDDLEPVYGEFFNTSELDARYNDTYVELK